MMTDGDVSARDFSAGHPGAARSVTDHLPGHFAIAELLEVQSTIPRRAAILRWLGKTPLSPETRLMYQSVIGEVEVGQALAALGAEWVVLHSLPVASGGSDVDHLVIGPAGVFIVTSRNHTRQNVWASQRTFIVGGIRYPDIRNMEFEMGRVERLLSTATKTPVEVSGILAVVAPKSLTVRQKHRDVEVLAAGDIPSWLKQRRAVLSPEQVSEIAAAAGRASTWHVDVETAADHRELREKFQHLSREVTGAWRRQLGWAIALTAVVAGGFIALTHAILLASISQH